MTAWDSIPRDPRGRRLDLVITNAIIIDTWGIVKADIGIKDGFICGIGKAGNPLMMDGVSEGMIIGVGTEVISAENMIVTAGGVDSHVHFIVRKSKSRSKAVSLPLLGRHRAATGTLATNCTSGVWNLRRILSDDALPINMVFLGRGNSDRPEALAEQVHAGAAGLKIHEDWGDALCD